jgi:hypothetical protein
LLLAAACLAASADTANAVSVPTRFNRSANSMAFLLNKNLFSF